MPFRGTEIRTWLRDRISTTLIDAAKDWESYPITNIGAPPSDTDVLARGLVNIYSGDYGLSWVDLGPLPGFGTLEGGAYLGNGIAIIGDENGRIYRSTDYGLTWVDLGGIAGNEIFDIANLGNGTVIIGSTDWHIYRSTDYGLTWVDLGAIAGNEIFTLAYLGNDIAIMGDRDGHVFRSTDNGATWNDLGVIATGWARGMAYLGNRIAIMGDENGHVYRSIDDGATWNDLGVIATGWALDMADLGNGIAIMGDENGHICRSTDYGATWVDLGAIAGGINQTMAYLDNGVVILGDVAHHIYRSTSAFQLSNFNPNQLDKVLQFGCLGAITPNGTSYLAPGNGATQANEIRVRVPRPGILKNLYVWQRVASGAAGRTDIYTVRVNGGNTAITCTLDNATEGSDITNQVLVAAGDQVSISLVSNNVADTSADVVAVVELM